MPGLADAVVTRFKIGVEGQRDGAVTQRKITFLAPLGGGETEEGATNGFTRLTTLSKDKGSANQ